MENNEEVVLSIVDKADLRLFAASKENICQRY